MSVTVYNQPLPNYPVATETIGGENFQLVKLVQGDAGSTSAITNDTPLPTASAAYATRIDEASATVSYVGKAALGSATSAAAWQIQKLDSTSGLIVTWADSNADFDNVWDNRASLTYG